MFRSSSTLRPRLALALLAVCAASIGCSTNRSLSSGDGVSDWLEVRGDAGRSGARTPHTIEPPLYLSWRKKAGRSPVVEPSLAGNVLFVAGTDRQLRLLEVETGDTVWKRKLDGIPSTNVAVSGGRAFVGHVRPEAALLAVSVIDGKQLWRTKEVRPAGGTVVRGDTLFVWDLGKGPAALDAKTGDVLWTSEIPGRWPAPLAHARGALIASCELDSVWALSSRDGSRLWAAHGSDGAIGAPAIAADRVIVPGAAGDVRAFDLGDGSVVWSRELPSRLTSAACVVDDVAYFGALNARMYAVDVDTGDVLWNVELDGVCKAAPAYAGDALVVVTMSGTCQLVSRSGRKVVHTVDLRRPVRVAPVVRGDRLYAIDDGGHIYAYESS